MNVIPPSERAEELFLAACDLPPGEREGFLARECDAPDVRREVDRLLADLDRAGAAQFLEPAPADDASPLPTRTRLGEYEIVRRLGAGGSGRVYEARHLRLNRRVAVKVLSEGARRDPDALARFRREVGVVGALAHPNVVAATDARQYGPHLFLVTELLDGVTVRSLMSSRERLPVAAAAEIARQLADGLQCLADHGLVHRDLSPSNVMVTVTGRVAILDFGLATLTAGGGTHLTGSGALLGTLGYIAPEQAEDARAVSPRADQYSLGCLLYALLTGHPPFRETPDVPLRVWLNRLATEPPPDVGRVRADVPPELAVVCSRLLATRPTDRFGSPREVSERLGALATGHRLATLVREGKALSGAQGETGVVPPEGRQPRRLVPRSARWWTSRGILASVSLAACVIAAVVLFLRRDPPATPGWIPVPLTAALGREAFPAVSPDGRSVAYAWGGADGTNIDLYVADASGHEARRLTTHPDKEVAPAWSPDSRRLAFWRHHGSRAQLLTVAVTGGDEEVLWEIDESVSHLDWAPDGRSLMFTLTASAGHPAGVYSHSVGGAELRLLVPTPSGETDLAPRVSPDGSAVAFVRRSAVVSDDQRLLVAPLSPSAGEPRTVLARRGFFRGLDWTADGRELVFSFDRSGRNRLWRVAVSGGSDPSEVLTPLTSSLATPTVSRAGGRLTFVAVSDEWTIWRQRIGTPDAIPPPEPLFATNRCDDAPTYSPDGRRVAFASDRSGHSEIWVYDVNTRTTRQLTRLAGPDVGSPHWHPDGTRLVFDSTRDGMSGLFEVDSGGGQGEVRRIAIEGVTSAVLPSWTGDGMEIVFQGRSVPGHERVYKVAAGGGRAALLTPDHATAPKLSADRRQVYFLDDRQQLCRVAATGGVPEAVDDQRYIWNEWAVGRSGVYSLERRGPPRGRLVFRGFSEAGVRPLGGYRAEHVYLNGRYPGGRVAVSPDETELLYVEYTKDGSNVYVLDGFR